MRSPSRPVDPLLRIGGTKRETFRNLELPCARRTAAQVSRKFLVAIDPPNFEKKFAKLWPGVTLRSLPGRTALWTWEDGPAGSQVGGALPDSRPSSWVALPGRGGAPRTWDPALPGPGSAPSHLGARALPPGSAPSQHLGPRAPSLGPRAPRSKVPGGSEVPTWVLGGALPNQGPGMPKKVLDGAPTGCAEYFSGAEDLCAQGPPAIFWTRRDPDAKVSGTAHAMQA